MPDPVIKQSAMTSLGYWRAVPTLVGGALLGLFILIAARVEYYTLMEYRPNMAPQIAYFLWPMLLAFILLVSLPLESLFRHWRKPSTHLQAFLIGLAYSSILIWWAFPGHWGVFFFFNPLVLRSLIGLKFHHFKVCMY